MLAVINGYVKQLISCMVNKSITLYKFLNDSAIVRKIKKKIGIYLYNIKYEPESSADWLSLSWDSVGVYSEMYMSNNNIPIYDKATELLIIRKYEKLFLCKHLKRKELSTEFLKLSQRLQTPSLSSVRFFIIEYIHPGLKSPKAIHLPASYYIIGNHILSDLFIKRYLAYNYGSSCIFDSEYTLTIVDNNYRIVSIKQSMSIEIYENYYKIIN